jgi:hypothetical protein
MLGLVTAMLRARRRLLPLALAVLFGARGARAQDPYASAVADAIPRVEQAVGLRFKHAPHVELRTRAQVREFLAGMLNDENSARALAAQQTVFRRLGIIPDTLDWHALQLRLLAEQVVAFYDPRSKVLYLESDAEEEALGIVIPHELVHALQDQYMDLDSLEDLRGDDDRVLAAEAVFEGQATLVSFEVALGFGPDFPEGEEAIRESVREERAQQPVMAGAPFFAQELAAFPYLSGLEFMVRFKRERPGQMPFGADLPTSTAQILHRDTYFAVPRAQPLTVVLPVPRGAVLEFDNVMGEFATRAFLSQLLRDRKRSERASAGWAGDRYALLRAPAGDGLAWITLWDSPADAREFADAMRRVVAQRYRKPPSHGDGPVTTFEPPGRRVTVWTGEVGGHAAVVYQDLPQEIPAGVFDLQSIRVQ